MKEPRFKGLTTPVTVHLGSRVQHLVDNHPLSFLFLDRLTLLLEARGSSSSWWSATLSNKIGLIRNIPAVLLEATEGSATALVRGKSSGVIQNVAVPQILPWCQPSTTHFLLFLFGLVFTRVSTKMVAL